MVRWSAALYDLPTSDLPDLHDVGEQTIDCIQKMAITTVTHLFLDFHMISLFFLAQKSNSYSFQPWRLQLVANQETVGRSLNSSFQIEDNAKLL